MGFEAEAVGSDEATNRCVNRRGGTPSIATVTVYRSKKKAAGCRLANPRRSRYARQGLQTGQDWCDGQFISPALLPLFDIAVGGDIQVRP